MIVVVADDLTGAAEVAGAAFDAGFRAEVQLEFDPQSSAEVIVVDTDTRWREPAEAAEQVSQIVRVICATAPQQLFKKVDSVLRGPVWAELSAMLAASGKRKAILIPANPMRQRVIRNGQMWVANQPLAQTPLARDPEYPRSSSFIPDLLGCATQGTERQAGQVQTDTTQQALAAQAVTLLPRWQSLEFDAGVLVPDVEQTADLELWASRVDQATLAVGGVEFFQAWLRLVSKESLLFGESPAPSLATHTAGTVPDAAVTRPPAAGSREPALTRTEITSRFESCNTGKTGSQEPALKRTSDSGAAQSDRNAGSACRTLFVCGSATAWVLRREQAIGSQLPMVTVPAELFDPRRPVPVEPWLRQVDAVWSLADRVMVAIGDAPASACIAPRQLVQRFAQLVVALLQRFPVECLCLEGGATAAAVLQHEATSRFRVTRTYGPGIVELTVSDQQGPRCIVKPGSYAWPSSIWEFDRPVPFAS